MFAQAKNSVTWVLAGKKKNSDEVMSDHWQVQEGKKLDQGFASRACVGCLTLKGQQYFSGIVKATKKASDKTESMACKMVCVSLCMEYSSLC